MQFKGNSVFPRVSEYFEYFDILIEGVTEPNINMFANGFRIEIKYLFKE